MIARIWMPWLMLACVPVVQADVPPPTPGRVAIYKSVGSLQCSGGGLSLAAMQRQLAAARVRVLATACGSDGQMRAQVCGSPDGAIRIFEIPADQLASASQAGFRPLSELPDAVREPCR